MSITNGEPFYPNVGCRASIDELRHDEEENRIKL